MRVVVRQGFYCNMAHLYFFWRFVFADKLFLMLVGCYCKLHDIMFNWLVVESVSICYVLYFTWYDSTKYCLSLKAVFSVILFSHTFYSLRNFSPAFLDIYLTLHNNKVDSILYAVTEAFLVKFNIILLHYAKGKRYHQ